MDIFKPEDENNFLKKELENITKEYNGKDVILKFEKVYARPHIDNLPPTYMRKDYYVFPTEDKKHVAIFLTESGRLQVTKPYSDIITLVEKYMVDESNEFDMFNLSFAGDCSNTVSLLTLDEKQINDTRKLLTNLDERLSNN